MATDTLIYKPSFCQFLMELLHPLQLFCGVWGSLLAFSPKNWLSLKAEIHLLQPVSYTLHAVVKTMGKEGKEEKKELMRAIFLFDSNSFV